MPQKGVIFPSLGCGRNCSSFCKGGPDHLPRKREYISKMLHKRLIPPSLECSRNRTFHGEGTGPPGRSLCQEVERFLPHFKEGKITIFRSILLISSHFCNIFLTSSFFGHHQFHRIIENKIFWENNTNLKIQIYPNLVYLSNLWTVKKTKQREIFL